MEMRYMNMNHKKTQRIISAIIIVILILAMVVPSLVYVIGV